MDSPNIGLNRQYLNELEKLECRDATEHGQEPPLVMDKALGSTIWDVEGRSYLDLCAGFGSLPLGHNHPEVVSVVANDLLFLKPPVMQGLGDVHPSVEKVEFLRILLKLLPRELNKASLAVTGSQAVEIAIKTALLATKGDGIIAIKNGYHGLDFGALSLNDRPEFTMPFSKWLVSEKVAHVDFGCQSQAIEQAIDMQARQGIKTAAIIAEPIQGRGGVHLPPSGWLEELYALATKKGMLLIFDEVYTGLGRSGKLTFAHDVPCDLLCLGKAIGGGMPLSACIGTQAVMDYWPESKGEAIHTGTFFGHPLACKVGRLTISLLLREKVIEKSVENGIFLRDLLSEALNSDSRVEKIRGSGMMNAIEFNVKNLAALVMSKLREKGVIAIPAGVQGECLSLTPPLNISRDHLREAVSKIHEVLSTCV
ncbi:MAG: aspartate aminotransferase family protein [Bdellovibrionota bacterium]